ncbi:hypothetical protein [Mucilaginibacter glaciei]|uniref:Outer membrane protein with beta-barrel domain n=1 Tax=Mucilaginibacter glaciei TaxID=2772109 RepID=A0A926NRE8_9SPHI|nr:hypothetical protein [Mucilaginibacter glaciei]MBD1393632.1 hypothetical protein [Mucilaginibacter glaciei]
MKKFILLTAAVFTAFAANAQYTYNTFGLGVGFSSVKGYTNVKRNYDEKAYNLNFIYNYSPYVPVAAEIQFGKLTGGGLTVDRDPYRRQYSNNYKAVILHADIYAGEVMDYEDSFFKNFLKNFFVGTGLGLIANNLTVQRTSLDDPNYVFPGDNSGVNIMIPLRAGYEIRLYGAYDQPFVGLILGYNHNIVFGEGLDGYDDPSSKFKNNALSQYRQITVGLRVNFGNEVSYSKSIRGGNN